MLIGIHQEFGDPLRSILISANFLGAKAYQTFIRSNRSMKRRAVSDAEVSDYNQLVLADKSVHYVAHAPYAMNPCRSDEYYVNKCRDVISEDLRFLGHLVGNHSYVLHPGSSLDLPWQDALDNLVCRLNEVYEFCYDTSIAVEIMAGAGTQVLSSSEQIDYFLDKVKDLPNVGLCYDTCHVFGAGMNLPECLVKYKDVIKVAHLNGSKAAFGTRVDRHASIQDSQIPAETLLSIAGYLVQYEPDIPIILETPGNTLLQDFSYLRDMLRKFE